MPDLLEASSKFILIPQKMTISSDCLCQGAIVAIAFLCVKYSDCHVAYLLMYISLLFMCKFWPLCCDG